MNLSNTLFILGAQDPEMVYIKNILKSVGAAIAHATVESKRVHAGNAYRAEGVDTFGNPNVLHHTEIVFIECDLPGAFSAYDERDGYYYNFHRIDHHKPGHGGYDVPPQYFMNGSSIGQLYTMLVDKFGIEFEDSFPSDLAIGVGVMYESEQGWYVSNENTGMIYTIPYDHVLAAAADHCPAAAYQNECPDVSPDNLMEWRMITRASFQGLSAPELLDTVQNTVQQLEHRVQDLVRIHGELPGHVLSVPEHLQKDTLPELPEAALRLGIAVEAQVSDRDGRKKRVLMGNTTPKIVEEWMNAYKNMGCEVYGNPTRGYAGAYFELSQEELQKFAQLRARANMSLEAGISHEVVVTRDDEGNLKLDEVYIGA